MENNQKEEATFMGIDSEEVQFWKNILASYITYEETSGLFIWHTPLNKKFKKGDIAGSKRIKEYVNFKFKGRQIHGHRLAFIAKKGYLPKLVDHKDQNKSNNKWDNLREASHSINSFNTGIKKSNSSGCTGVHFNKIRNKWIATIGIKKRSVWLGQFNDFKKAVQARTLAENKYAFYINKIPVTGRVLACSN